MEMFDRDPKALALASLLSAAGFAAVVRRPFKPDLDDDRRQGSLYLRASKPPVAIATVA